jgi:hypothetical protein
MAMAQRPVAELVRRIHAVNTGWKLARERFGNDDALARSLRDLKDRMQVRLLRHPEVTVTLTLDPSMEEEAVYSMDLAVSTEGHPETMHAAHIPHRTLATYLSPTELQRALRADSSSS